MTRCRMSFAATMRPTPNETQRRRWTTRPMYGSGDCTRTSVNAIGTRILAGCGRGSKDRNGRGQSATIPFRVTLPCDASSRKRECPLSSRSHVHRDLPGSVGLFPPDVQEAVLRADSPRPSTSRRRIRDRPRPTAMIRSALAGHARACPSPRGRRAASRPIARRLAFAVDPRPRGRSAPPIASPSPDLAPTPRAALGRRHVDACVRRVARPDGPGWAPAKPFSTAVGMANVIGLEMPASTATFHVPSGCRRQTEKK